MIYERVKYSNDELLIVIRKLNIDSKSGYCTKYFSAIQEIQAWNLNLGVWLQKLIVENQPWNVQKKDLDYNLLIQN